MVLTIQKLERQPMCTTSHPPTMGATIGETPTTNIKNENTRAASRGGK